MEQQEAMLLWEEHYDDILSSARKYTQHKDVQSELVHEAFLYFIEGDKWEDIPKEDHEQFLKLARATLRLKAHEMYNQKILSTNPREVLSTNVNIQAVDSETEDAFEYGFTESWAVEDRGGFNTMHDGHYRNGMVMSNANNDAVTGELEGTELIATIKWVIRSYPADKQLMVMDMVYGDTQKEVADTHKIPQQTVSYWWNKFKDELNEELNDAE